MSLFSKNVAIAGPRIRAIARQGLPFDWKRPKFTAFIPHGQNRPQPPRHCVTAKCLPLVVSAGGNDAGIAELRHAGLFLTSGLGPVPEKCFRRRFPEMFGLLESVSALALIISCP